MPFPVSFHGSFDCPADGDSIAAALVADRIERALRSLGAREVERRATSLGFIGPSAWTAARSNSLLILARGEVEVDAPAVAAIRRRVRYSFRATKGLGVLLALSTAIEVYILAVGGMRLPQLAFPGFILALWAIAYVKAWLRVPLLLMRAAAGELEASTPAAPSVIHRDAAT